MKQLIALLLLCTVLGGCTGTEKRYETSFAGVFDTVTQVVAYARSEGEFAALVQEISEELGAYHRAYDAYHVDAENLKTVNDNAGAAPVRADEKLMELLRFGKEIYAETDGRVNIAMGSVTELWREAREQRTLPAADALEEAAAHTDLQDVILGENTVFFADPALRLDVGAIAKGYAAQRVAEKLPAGVLLSVGGNVCCTGARPDGTAWSVGVQDPAGGAYLQTLAVTGGAVVTSGDYQRYFTVSGKRYHHIIDPETNYPAECWRAVTVVHADSAVADALSTALFLMTREEGTALLSRMGGAALWITQDGTVTTSAGFPR